MEGLANRRALALTVLDEALLVERELLLEGSQVSSVHCAAERHEVAELVFLQQRGRGEDAQRQTHLREELLFHLGLCSGAAAPASAGRRGVGWSPLGLL